MYMWACVCRHAPSLPPPKKDPPPLFLAGPLFCLAGPPFCPGVHILYVCRLQCRRWASLMYVESCMCDTHTGAHLLSFYKKTSLLQGACVEVEQHSPLLQTPPLHLHLLAHLGHLLNFKLSLTSVCTVRSFTPKEEALLLRRHACTVSASSYQGWPPI